MMNVDGRLHRYGISRILYVCFLGLFAGITPAIIFGAGAGRLRFIPCMVFTFLWTTLVFDFVGHWVWSKHGWLGAMGVFDYAGGTPVHVTSGAAALVLGMKAGRRKGFGVDEEKPHNLSQVYLGTGILWFGWFAFNGELCVSYDGDSQLTKCHSGGSALAPNARAAIAMLDTHLAACAGGVAWVAVDYMRHRKYSLLGFCSGSIAGLVCVTPGSGFLTPSMSVVVGLVAGVVCNAATRIKYWLQVDDAMDVFAVHGVGAMVSFIACYLYIKGS
jgi:Amt family ammonium transporter